MKKKLIAASLLVASFISGGVTNHLHGRHQLKHTQNAQCINKIGDIYIFMRPNKELFTMQFDNTPGVFLGVNFRDITYYDVNSNTQHFVKSRVQ